MEAFVGTELLALADASSGRFSVGHYRDDDKREIDFMVEDHDSDGCTGIEVKAGTTVGTKDFEHLEWFDENLAADRPFAGVVQHAGSVRSALRRETAGTADERAPASLSHPRLHATELGLRGARSRRPAVGRRGGR